jgi:hypothetical protein
VEIDRIAKFPHHIHTQLQVNFVTGHCCLLQCRSVQSLCSQCTVSAKATCISRIEDLETLAGWSLNASEVHTETEAGIAEVSIKTVKTYKNG